MSSSDSMIGDASATTTSHIVTGLVPGAGYGVAFENVGGERRVTVTAGDAEVVADEAGVVTFDAVALSRR